LKGKIVVVGASGHAKVIIDIVERQDCFAILGIIDTFQEVGTKLMGYEIIGREDAIPGLIAAGEINGGIIGIGHNWIRHEVASRIRALAPEFRFVNAVHPSAQLAREVTLGQGVAIMAGVSVNPGTQIGDFCFLNTNASVDHDNTMGEFSCLQPNAATGGNVTIGAFSNISLSANVIQGVRVGPHTVIGAGSTVLSDIQGLVVAYGTPCRVIRRREPADCY
jgi:sugar O-acyltransferase (sialic acid O-acetyltransferase NeuD family)